MSRTDDPLIHDCTQHKGTDGVCLICGLPPPTPPPTLPRTALTVEDRVTALERYVYELVAASKAAIERIENLEPAHPAGADADVQYTRTTLARMGPFRASAHDRDTITNAEGRRILAVFNAGERDLVLRALNDLYIAETT